MRNAPAEGWSDVLREPKDGRKETIVDLGAFTHALSFRSTKRALECSPISYTYLLCDFEQITWPLCMRMYFPIGKMGMIIPHRVLFQAVSVTPSI